MTMTSIGITSRLVATASLAGLAAFVVLARPSAQALGDAFSTAGRPQAITAIGADVTDWGRRVAALERQGDLRLVSSREDTMVEGRVHDRYDQYVGGVRVVGGQVLQQRSADGVVSIFGQLYPTSSESAVPTLSLESAFAKAAAILGREPMTGAPSELVWLPRDNGLRLCWMVHGFTRRDAVRLFLDAKTGEEVARHSVIRRQQSAVGTGTGVFSDRKKMSASGSGSTFQAEDRLRPPLIRTFDLKGNLQRAFNILNGAPTSASDVATDSDNAWTDGAVVDAHTYLGYTYDYYFKKFDRRGIDNQNLPIQAMTHPVLRSDVINHLDDDDVIGLFVLNAFWCGVCGPGGRGMMVFGDGLPPGVFNIDVNYFSAAIDIVGHELTHGVVSYTSDLDFGNEPGALNEAFADMMGIGVEFMFQQPGTGVMRADYTMGEDLVPSPVPGFVRSASDPQRFGNPDHYSRRYVGPDDDGGVHINSTIGSHAYFLAIEGGTNRTSGQTVTGVGAANREQIERIFYRGFTQFLPSNATFSMARQATLRAASDLYGGSSQPYRAVEQAWNAVGVQ